MGKYRRYNCPFCPAFGNKNDDKALSINWTKGFYRCFRCGTSGHVSSLPANFKAPLILKEKKGTNKKDISFMKKDMISLRYSTVGQKYLAKRGLDFLPLENFVFVSNKKLTFPFYGEEGNILYYVGRKMWGSGRRYDNAISSIKNLFIPYGAITPCKKTLVVTEGIFDALSVYQWTGLTSIALLGKNIGNNKILRILEYSYPETSIVILLDAGEKETSQAYYDEIRSLRKNTVIHKLKDGDPNSIGKDELRKVLSNYGRD